MKIDAEKFSGAGLDQAILDCAERWGYSGKGSNYNPILGPLLLQIFRRQVSNDEISDKELRPLLELCQKKDEQFHEELKVGLVVLSVFVLGVGIYLYRSNENLKKKKSIESVATYKNLRRDKTA